MSRNVQYLLRDIKYSIFVYLATNGSFIWKQIVPLTGSKRNVFHHKRIQLIMWGYIIKTNFSVKLTANRWAEQARGCSVKRNQFYTMYFNIYSGKLILWFYFFSNHDRNFNVNNVWNTELCTTLSAIHYSVINACVLTPVAHPIQKLNIWSLMYYLYLLP
jgi:hypothetical protein